MAPSGTMVNGVFRTTIFIPCEDPAARRRWGNVTAIVDGARRRPRAARFTPVTSTTNNPCS